VIDSGVHVAHAHIGSVAGGVSVAPDGTIEEGSFPDRLGHGTAVMAAIQEKAPDADYFAVKVFDGSLSTTARALFRGIEWAIEGRMDIVNLSLGTCNQAHADRFRELIQQALDAGISLVAAREAGGQRCFPGCLSGVLGVSLDEQCGRDSYGVQNTADGVVFLASGYPRPAPGIPKERNLQGISFAVANITGFAARALQELDPRSPAALRSALIHKATPNTASPP
jgi:subtilisin family serine protease